jgi:hypothetical protein
MNLIDTPPQFQLTCVVFAVFHFNSTANISRNGKSQSLNIFSDEKTRTTFSMTAKLGWLLSPSLRFGDMD